MRHFTQDDAHIYCTPAQLDAKCRAVIALVLDIYRQFGFDDVRIKLSTRPEHRMGDDAVWDQLEAVLTWALEGVGVAFDLNSGEGAFYGPKLEFVLRDAIGRDWQCSTLQVDMNLPERFTGILIEHHAGKLPPWLAPVQAMVLSITDDQADYARKVTQLLHEAGLRAEPRPQQKDRFQDP